MANRANKVASALVRDQTGYDPRPLGLTTAKECLVAAHAGIDPPDSVSLLAAVDLVRPRCAAHRPEPD